LLKNVFNIFIGAASDGANVMVGEHNSFFSHLKQDVPHAILMRCICHSAALVASKACEELPRGPEDLLRNIDSYISGSANDAPFWSNCKNILVKARRKFKN
jgi:hypothetical protein